MELLESGNLCPNLRSGLNDKTPLVFYHCRPSACANAFNFVPTINSLSKTYKVFIHTFTQCFLQPSPSGQVEVGKQTLKGINFGL